MGAFFLQDLAIVMLVAALVTVLCNLIRQPVVVGYLLAGVIIGPNTPLIPVSAHPDSVETLAKLGLVMLMFGLGLQFSVGKLVKVVPTALAAASLEILLMIWIGYQAGQAFGWTRMESIFLGAVLLSSSTIIIVRALKDMNLSQEKFAGIISGILVLDDVYAILAIVALTALATTESVSLPAVVQYAQNLGIFLTVTFVGGLLLVPYLLRYVANLKNDEILLIMVLGLGFGMALLGVKLGYSAALGAFVIGAIIGETRLQGRIDQLIEPIRNMFGAIFFVAVGMMFDPVAFLQYWPQILVIAALLVVGKTSAVAVGSMLAGHELRVSLRAGMGMAQIGEFAFVIAQIGLLMGKISPFFYTVVISVSAITAFMTPYMVRHSDRLAGLIEWLTPRPLLEMLAVYQRWIGRGPRNPMYLPVRKLVRKTIVQIILNLILISAIFVAAAFAVDYTAPWWPQTDVWGVARHSVFWALAMLLSLPLVAATFRKLRAMAMLMAEMSITSAVAGQRTGIIRVMFINAVLTAGVLGMAVLLIVLSSAIMPPWPVLAVVLLGLAILAKYKWNAFIQIYAAAQAEIGETVFPPELRDDPDKQEQPQRVKPLPAMLYAAELEMVHVDKGSPFAGKFIRETECRAVTGASVVGIERKGENLINPSPNEEIHPGDNLLLLGTKSQLAAARQMIAPPPA